jgi:hypothetical protein
MHQIIIIIIIIIIDESEALGEITIGRETEVLQENL